MEKSNRQRHKPLFACFLILSILFAYTLHLRSPYFGKMADGIFEDQTARTLKFAKNWYRDGILNDRFLQIENPDSIEFSSLEQRKPYVSFLPGTVVPVYILSKITQSEPTIEIVHGYNLASQYMCALLLAGIAWVLGAFTSNWHRIIAALLAGSFYILNPFLIYNHQQIFYSDAALMLPLLSFIFIQSLKLCYNVKGFKINFALAVSMFCLVFTDWYGLFIAFMWGLFRLSDEKLSIRNRIMELRVLAIPIFLCLIFFILQIWSVNLFDVFHHRLEHRISGATEPVNSAMNQLYTRFWNGYFPKAFGKYAPLILISLCLLIAIEIIKSLSKQRKSTKSSPELEIICYLVLSPLYLMHINLTHFYEHEYSPIRFAPIFSIAPLILIRFFYCIKNVNRKRIACNFALILSAAYSLNLFYSNGWKQYYKEHIYRPYTIAEFVKENASYDDIIFSPNFETHATWPTQNLSISMKRIYLINKLTDILNFNVNDYAIYKIKGHSFKIPINENSKIKLLIAKNKPCLPIHPSIRSTLMKPNLLVKETADLLYFNIPYKLIKTLDKPICGSNGK